MTIDNQTVIEFRNRYCRSNCHQNCEGSWNGFGFEFACNCSCHHKKNEALDSIGEPVANTIHDVQPFSVGGTIDNG